MNKIIERLGAWPFVIVGVMLIALGLLALNHIATNIWPIDVQRLDLVRDVALDQADPTTLLQAGNAEVIIAFLAALLVAVTGFALPLVYYLNKRFGRSPLPHFLVILRQAMWVGLWIAFCVWLQMNRTLGWAVILLVVAVLFMFEFLLQVRTRTEEVTRGQREEVAG